MAVAIGAAYLPMRDLPDRLPAAPAVVALDYRPVQLTSNDGPLRIAGAWELHAADSRFGGISGLALSGEQFVAVSDRGSFLRFDAPTSSSLRIRIDDLRAGPGPFGNKWSRDAESVARDPAGRGWWVGYEQNHSLWLYDRGFSEAVETVELEGVNWRENGGAEGLAAWSGGLLALGENGRDAVGYVGRVQRLQPLRSIGDIADAAVAPDGTVWVLLRRGGLGGFDQFIAPLLRTEDGWRTGRAWAVPKGPLDNLEGMAISAVGERQWRFWLISDDGHRIFARTLLIALDVDAPARHDESPTQGTGLSDKR